MEEDMNHKCSHICYLLKCLVTVERRLDNGKVRTRLRAGFLRYLYPCMGLMHM